MSRRTQRVEDLLRSTLSQVILREVSDPRVKMTTVAAVEVSPDLRHAVIRVSVIGDDEMRSASVEALRHAAGFIRRQLATRLKGLRYIPELRFEMDRGAEHSQRISDLLESLHGHDEGT